MASSQQNLVRILPPGLPTWSVSFWSAFHPFTCLQVRRSAFYHRLVRSGATKCHMAPTVQCNAHGKFPCESGDSGTILCCAALRCTMPYWIWCERTLRDNLSDHSRLTSRQETTDCSNSDDTHSVLPLQLNTSQASPDQRSSHKHSTVPVRLTFRTADLTSVHVPW